MTEPAPDAREIAQRLEQVRPRISSMCAEHRPPRMTIPAHPQDDDLFICQVADDAHDALLALLARLEAEEREIALQKSFLDDKGNVLAQALNERDTQRARADANGDGLCQVIGALREARAALVALCNWVFEAHKNDGWDSRTTPDAAVEAYRVECFGLDPDLAVNPAGLADTMCARAAIAETLRDLRELCSRQAEDEGLWFQAKTAPEAYLQQELRKLHGVIEGASP